ncbi:MAG: hypothetical protein ACR2ML_09290 [Solirubrobacteraceae bacterium]
MTVVVAFVGADGAVMASDSEGTESGHTRLDVEKCWPCGGLMVGLSGATSVRQPLEAVLERRVQAQFGGAAEVDRWEARELIRRVMGEELKRSYGGFVASRQGETPQLVLGSALIVVGRDSHGYWLLEVDHNASATFYTDHSFHTVGSGSAAAYLAHGLMKHYGPRGRTLEHVKLVAYRTVDTCINVTGGALGVGGYVQLYASKDDGPFERADREETEILADGLDKWTLMERESLDKVVLGEEMESSVEEELPGPIEEG